MAAGRKTAKLVRPLRLVQEFESEPPAAANTGDPDMPTGPIEERESFVVQYDAMNGVYDCERIEP